MTSREDFIRECIARPTDMGARLVFADWLEEQGESAEAEDWKDYDSFKYQLLSGPTLSILQRILNGAIAVDENGYVELHDGWNFTLSSITRVILAEWQIEQAEKRRNEAHVASGGSLLTIGNGKPIRVERYTITIQAPQ